MKMARKTISNSDLVWMIHEKLNQFADHPQHGISIAIVPASENKREWRVVTSRTIQMKRPLWTRRVQAIEKQLRKEFVLSAD